MNIVTEEDIIKTYPLRQQRFAKQYLSVMKLAASCMGITKIKSKFRNIPRRTIHHWINKTRKPYPIKTIEELESKGWLSFNLNDIEKARWAAGICGFLFGDGHIPKKFEFLQFTSGFNENGRKDLEKINKEFYKCFGIKNKIKKRKAEFSKSKLSYQLTINSVPIARLFYCLGVPKGDKTKTKFSVPKWVYKHKDILREFLRGLLWAEIETPKIRNKTHVEAIRFSMHKYKYVYHHIKFLNKLKDCLEKFGIQTTKKGIFKEKMGAAFKFRIKSNYLNCLKLAKELPPLYSTEKKKRFDKTVEKIHKTKKIKSYEELLEKERETIKRYNEIMKLRKEMKWGKRRIAKIVDMDQGSIARWIYYGMKPRSFRNLEND